MIRTGHKIVHGISIIRKMWVDRTLTRTASILLDDVGLEIVASMIEEIGITNTDRIPTTIGKVALPVFVIRATNRITTTIGKVALSVMRATVIVEDDVILVEGDEVAVVAPIEKKRKKSIGVIRVIGNGVMTNRREIAIEAMILKGVAVVVERKSVVPGMETTTPEGTGHKKRVMMIKTTMIATIKIAGRDRIERVPIRTTKIAAKIEERN